MYLVLEERNDKSFCKIITNARSKNSEKVQRQNHEMCMRVCIINHVGGLLENRREKVQET